MESKTHIVILGLLSERPLSGYDIKKLIDLRFRFFWNESYGQIYPQLKKLQTEGLITSLEKQTQGRSKAKYAITESGRSALKIWLSQTPEKESVRIELLLKMYFGDSSQPSVLAQHIKGFQENHQRDLAMLSLFKKELQSIPDPDHNHQNILSVIEFGIKTNQAYLAWCEESLAQLEVSHESK